ncbi:MAG: glycoside hydrolase family 3 C-terminal domain-containing protein, partial [Candidatus Parvarchaeota archaeon]|nr:glycoside hydrolase family 3 C-terminal domain-containing protein [Candidatus Jingweiarchaeum tengchongense]
LLDAVNYLLDAVKKGLISEKEIDTSVRRLLLAKFKLGLFDPSDKVKYAQIPYEINDSDTHRKLALKMARESIVLLKNESSLLPLPKNLKSIAVIGPSAYDKKVLRGNYFGDSSRYVTILDGIREKISKKTKMYYTKGCDFLSEDVYSGGFSEALSMAKRAEAVIMCMGLSPILEGEENEVYLINKAGDRENLNLPAIQEELIKVIYSTGKPIILVLTNGSPLAISWEQEHIPAILESWYPGEEGGNAVADVIFGDYNPAGRLPITFVKSLDQLPPFTDYSMRGRTYRYMNEAPLYPFGYGLSYTEFEYKNLTINPEKVKAGQSVKISVDVTNVGRVIGDEVVQLYLKHTQTSAMVPNYELKGFRRIHLKSGQTKRVIFNLSPKQMTIVNDNGESILEAGKIKVMVGSSQPDKRSFELTGKKVLEKIFELV